MLIECPRLHNLLRYLSFTRTHRSLPFNFHHYTTKPMATFNHVPEKPAFPSEEEKIISFWEENDIFKKSFEISKGRETFSFYDGPPFATGLPHYGHILAGTMKDIIVRYAFLTGHSVERRFGWDCHGLPVEYEIDKAKNITSRKDVLQMGIDTYNAYCREIVMRYAKQWEVTVGRLGRWIDFKNDYKTMDKSFMESCWWACKQLYEKNMIYKSFRVMPYSTACSTPLSNFEVNLNYKDVSDPSLTVSFPLIEDPSIEVLAWTTTPWTLVSNLALTVHPEFDYVIISIPSKNKKFLIARCRLNWLCQEMKLDINADIVELSAHKGIDLSEKRYKPLFNFFHDSSYNYKNTAFRIITGTYVTDDTGTGIVHCAPAFGEVDFDACREHGIWAGSPLPCPVDESGMLTSEVGDFSGMYFKDADKLIRQKVKGLGRLIINTDTVHSYPHCWRSDTPLMYKAVPSWFIRVESMREKLLKTTSETYWVPQFVKEKRFQNWIADARDWCFSRNRFWGTPVPIWMSQDESQIMVIGSVEELEKYAGHKLHDIHREFIDHITIPDPRGDSYPPLKRIDEVFDCWFESGSMPYARLHFPFENQEAFTSSFPADFVGEGIDQTRGWFYTLMVLATALFEKPAFKNLIATGLVLAEDGKKMSKRLKNYPDPTHIVHLYGADALRIYLINSPVVRAETLRFKEQGVKDVVKDVLLPWFHAYRFFVQEATRFETSTGFSFKSLSMDLTHLSNSMDRWIISYMEHLTGYFHREMKAYRLYTIVPKLLLFLDQLTNWYVRLNRDRMKGKTDEQDTHVALNTLYIVLLNITIIMTPYSPFICEHFYQNLKQALPKDHPLYQESINFVIMPQNAHTHINQHIENTVQNMQKVINLGRLMREKRHVPRKTPLRCMTVMHADSEVTKDLQTMEGYIREELNVQSIKYNNDMSGIKLTATPNFKALGAKLGKNMKVVQSGVKHLSQKELTEYVESGEISVGEFTLYEGDLFIQRSSEGNQDPNLEVDSDNPFSLILDFTEDKELQDQAKVREIVNRIQKLRKQFGFNPMDTIEIWLYSENSHLANLFNKHSDVFHTTLRRPINWGSTPPTNSLHSTQISFEDAHLTVTFTGNKFNTQSDFPGLKHSLEKLSLQNGTLTNVDKTSV